MKEEVSWRQSKRVRMVGAAAIVVLLIVLALRLAHSGFSVGTIFGGSSSKDVVIERDPAGNPLFGATCERGAYSCSDFKTQKRAQEVYDTCNTSENPDRYKLAKAGNGVACPGLPKEK
jgi:hypothetical protein